MAVTQISRIQVRRGRKLSPTGIPQLASGEIAWAVDSQEVFIGNGSVAEGAPYVGNTKILTEHDDILALISSYKFGGADEDSVVPFSIPRSFQSKLDEYVSVLDFGAQGDGIVDNTLFFETAFAQLYQNTIETYRKALVIPNGEYIFDSDLRVPSFVILAGETHNGVVLRFTGDHGIKFVESIGGSESLIDYTESTRPQNIRISNVIIESAQSDVSGAKDVIFDNVTFKGNYTLSNPALLPREQTSSIYWANTLEDIEATDIRFNSCRFVNSEIAVRCDQSVVSRSKVIFNDCQFDSLDTGVLVIGVENQINLWKFYECRFSNTANHAIYISAGTGTVIKETSFERCGNFLNGIPAVPVVYFGQSQNNLMIDCSSDRQQSNGITTDELASYVPEVYGADKVSFITRNQAFVEPFESYTPIAVFSAFNKFMEINYSLVLETGDIRSGKMKLTIDKDSRIVNLSDDYAYTSPLGIANGVQNNKLLEIFSFTFGKISLGSVVSGENISQGTKIVQVNPETVDSLTGLGVYDVDRFPSTVDQPTSTPPNYQTINFTRDTMTNIQFQARLVDNDDSSGVEAVLLEYRQLSAARGASGTISFDVSYGTLSV